MKGRLFNLVLLAMLFAGCGNSANEAKPAAKAAAGSDGNSGSTSTVVAEPAVVVPIFNADSAYRFIDEQVAFGPRVPNTKGHKACGDYLEAKLREYGADVVAQEADLVAYNGETLHARNIIASFQPEKENRVLLCAHWDTRPWADSDPDPANHYKPYPGANDGGSGVGVLLEVARQLSSAPTGVGVDIVFFDAEDYGCHDAEFAQYGGDGWALGSEYWALNPHKKGYKARFGILLDIVGAPGSRFCLEYYSMAYAPQIVEKVWAVAHKAGYSGYFPYEQGGAITDDHVNVNGYLGVPCINIINCDPDSPNGFGPYHHTMKDDMEWIDTAALKAVGQTVLDVIYNEK